MISRSNIINELFIKFNFESYLEIGVRVPSENFDLILAKHKESVDPNPKGLCSHITTSDYFFGNIINRKYDVFFIDGLHTEEQSYRDVVNAIKYLNDGGFIIMHDCNPPTEYHTRSYDEYLKTGGQWNGTVYKAFIRLKSELKDWSCFVVDEDWGCGIITKRNILKNVCEINNVNNIRWEFFEKNRYDLLQIVSYEEYKKLLKY